MMELWTAATPNGWKVNIMVEELIEAGIEMPEMKIRSINLSKGEQFTDEFTEKNPNQKIPVLIDDTRSIMESCAILQYLGEKYPSPLLPSDGARWDVIPWVYWQAANVGPNFGNKLSYTSGGLCLLLPHTFAISDMVPGPYQIWARAHI